MKSLKYALCALLMVLLAGTAFAQVTGSQSGNISQINAIPAANGATTLYNVSVVMIVPSPSSSAAQQSSQVAQWYKDCNNDQACVFQKAQAYYSADKSYQFTETYLQNVPVSVAYFAQGKWIPIPACTNILTNIQGPALPQVAGAPTQYIY